MDFSTCVMEFAVGLVESGIWWLALVWERVHLIDLTVGLLARMDNASCTQWSSRIASPLMGSFKCTANAIFVGVMDTFRWEAGPSPRYCSMKFYLDKTSMAPKPRHPRESSSVNWSSPWFSSRSTVFDITGGILLQTLETISQIQLSDKTKVMQTCLVGTDAPYKWTWVGPWDNCWKGNLFWAAST